MPKRTFKTGAMARAFAVLFAESRAKLDGNTVDIPERIPEKKVREFVERWNNGGLSPEVADGAADRVGEAVTE